MNSLTIVSGYWDVKNKHGSNYTNDWFRNTLQINCPYVFFGNQDTIQLVKTYRGDLPTHYVACDVRDFYTYKYYPSIQTHPTHCPSKELNMIWNEKSYLVHRASQLNPFGSNWFAWVDAGICTYRDTRPPDKKFPDPDKLDKLPRDRFIFTTSENPWYEPHRIGSYYHYISGTFIIHSSFINRWIKVWTQYIDKYLSMNDWIYTDQVIYTIIYRNNPSLFYKAGDGYGAIIPLLY